MTPLPSVAEPADPEGGNFCPVTEALGWKGVLLSPEAIEALASAVETLPTAAGAPIAGTLEHGVAHCGWRSGDAE